MKKAAVYLSAILTVVLTVNKPVLADTLSDQLQIQQNQLQVDKNAYQNAQKNSEQIEQKIENLDNQIEALMDQVEANKKQIGKTQQDIKTAEQDALKAENDMKEEKELFKQRLRVMYINGTGGYLDILLESKSFSDFISRAETIKKFIELDNKIISELRAKEDELNKKKEALKQQNDKLLAIKTDNEKKVDELSKTQNEQKKLIADAKKQENLYAAAFKDSQAKVNQTLKQINTIRQSAQKYVPSRGAASISDNAVIAYASNFLGTPYVWGGTTPSGFDCSGYVQYVYRHFGIYLGRTTYDQINDGYAVSRDQLQAGDLLFFGTPGNPTHEGMYVGNGSYIHAPHTGDVVKISVLGRSDFLGARRVR
jgi:cell wall-associated NlpC family hydrolase